MRRIKWGRGPVYAGRSPLPEEIATTVTLARPRERTLRRQEGSLIGYEKGMGLDFSEDASYGQGA